MPTHPKFCTVAYCVSALLDAVDGQAARALGQTSKFGAILDMVTDRYGLGISLFHSLSFASRFRSRQELMDRSSCTGVWLHVYFVSWLRLIRDWRWYFNSSFLSISLPTTSTCMRESMIQLHLSLISRTWRTRWCPLMAHRSIASGNRSHKTVTKEQSWILWSYYNNSVSPLSLRSPLDASNAISLTPPSRS